MATITKPGGATTRRWYTNTRTGELFDVLVGDADDTAFSTDLSYTVVTSWDNAQVEAKSKKTVMPT